LGRTLDVNHVDLGEAYSGKVQRVSMPPAIDPQNRPSAPSSPGGAAASAILKK